MEKKPRATHCINCGDPDLEFISRDEYGFEYYVCNKDCSEEEGFIVGPPEAFASEF